MTSKDLEAVTTVEQDWLTGFTGEIASEADRGDVTYVALADTIKDLLVSEDGKAARNAAIAVDSYYANEFLASDPLLRFQEDKGMGIFLNTIYDIVLELALIIPYDDQSQDSLVNLLVELRKLPAKSYKIWNQDRLIYAKEPVFAVRVTDDWHGNDPCDDVEQPQPTEPEILKHLRQRCKEWVNFSSFLARCLQTGVMDRHQSRCRFANIDIANGLGKPTTMSDLATNLFRSSKVLVATQWILIAGGVLHEYYTEQCNGPSHERWGLLQWPIWVERLRAISSDEDCPLEIKKETAKALSKMISVTPELEDTSKKSEQASLDDDTGTLQKEI